MLFEEVDKNGRLSPKKWKDLETWQKVAVGGAVLGLGFIIYRGIKSFGAGNVQQVPVNPDLLQYTTTTGTTMTWNPDPLAKEIYENLDGGWNLYVYPETTDKILKLQDEQIKALYNHYNQYYAEDEPTLTQLIDGEWDDWGGSYAKAVAKLKSLGLNENAVQIPNGDYYRAFGLNPNPQWF